MTLMVTRLAKDQTEINRIIAEASKGSKFYEASLFVLGLNQVHPFSAFKSSKSPE